LVPSFLDHLISIRILIQTDNNRMTSTEGVPRCPFKVKSLFVFQAENEAEMDLTVGDLITVVKIEDEGWWEGTKSNGNRGLFPSNYVEIIDEKDLKKPPPKPAGLKLNINTSAAQSAQIAPKPTPSPRASPRAAAGGPGGAQSKFTPVVSSHNDNTAIANYGRAAAMTTYKPKHATGNLGLGEAKDQTNGTIYKAQSSVAGQAVRSGKSTTKFGPWAYNMAIITAYCDVLFGILAIIWRLVDSKNHTATVGYVGGYTLAVGVVSGLGEWHIIQLQLSPD
jgi:hypothetical protein